MDGWRREGKGSWAARLHLCSPGVDGSDVAHEWIREVEYLTNAIARGRAGQVKGLCKHDAHQHMHERLAELSIAHVGCEAHRHVKLLVQRD